jgi:predicted metalloprotease with PDZ domain
MHPVQRRALRILLLACLQLLLAGIAAAQTGPVSYTVRLDSKPASHLLHIGLEVNSAGADSIDVAMPAWSPGNYNIHNAWRNVQEFAAGDETGAALTFEKLDKQTWRIYRGRGSHITARYNLYYRGYDADLCYITGPSVFMYVVGKRPYPVQGPISVKVESPFDWRIHTGMEQEGGSNTFTASSYDTFVDASIALGVHAQRTEFDCGGVPHYVVFIGTGNFDKEMITRDFKTFVSYFVEMMGGAPYKKYIFFLRARPGQGAGGLEHLNSTDIGFSAYATHASRASYGRFLFVAAHEYFHLWNVKRIRPAILGPFDYSHEQNTRNLYVSEGMTSYWAALGLRRSGLWSREEYFENLATQISQLQSAPGRKIMSVELSSWDTWNRADNGQNSRIDYYNKGELLGNLLDLEIRYRTENRRSLTDVFLYLMRNNGLPKPGFEEKHGFRDVVESITREAAPARADFSEFFARYVSGTDEIPWNDFLDHAGLRLEEKKDKPVPYFGITTGTSIPSGFPGQPPTPVPQGQVAITNVAPDSPALDAGLDAGDIMVAIDGERVDPATVTQGLAEKKIGASVTFSVIRSEALVTIPVRVGQEEKVTYSVKEKSTPSDAQRAILKSWLEK